MYPQEFENMVGAIINDDLVCVECNRKISQKVSEDARADSHKFRFTFTEN